MASRCKGILSVDLDLYMLAGHLFLLQCIKLRWLKESRSVSLFWVSIHFRNTSTDTVHLLRLPSWVNCYRCCIVSGSMTQSGHRLVVACPRCCRIVMVWKVLLIHSEMKCVMWTVVISCACLNDVRSIPPQYSMWVRFRSAQYQSNQRLKILCYRLGNIGVEWCSVNVYDW